MPSRAGLKITFFITGRKILSARWSLLFLSGFLSLLAYLWVSDSFFLSFRAFLFLCPYVFLFSSQDMMKEEIDSGMLENVLFIRGDFRSYLILKNIMVTAIAGGLSCVLFLCYALFGLASGQLPDQTLSQFLNGQLAGVYYVVLAGFLSLFLRAGSNVLLVILGQVCLLAGLLFSAAQRASWIGRLTSSSHPGLAAKLEFLAAAAVFPNLIIGQKSGILILGLAASATVLVSLQWAYISTLELRRR
ncbi:MAG: hypothetical protein AB1715_10375 [Acidobacteriota bacterium]